MQEKEVLERHYRRRNVSSSDMIWKLKERLIEGIFLLSYHPKSPIRLFHPVDPILRFWRAFILPFPFPSPTRAVDTLYTLHSGATKREEAHPSQYHNPYKTKRSPNVYRIVWSSRRSGSRTACRFRSNPSNCCWAWGWSGGSISLKCATTLRKTLRNRWAYPKEWGCARCCQQ